MNQLCQDKGSPQGLFLQEPREAKTEAHRVAGKALVQCVTESETLLFMLEWSRETP